MHATVPWLSQYRIDGFVWDIPSSWNNDRSQMIWRAQWEPAMYSALHVDKATSGCCFELQEMGPLPHSTMYPEIDLHISHIPQSASLNARKRGVCWVASP